MGGPRVTKTYFMLLVADMDRAVRFYSDAFGGEVAFTSQEWSELTVAGASVALHAGDMGADTRTGLGVEVEDLEPALMTLTAAGGRVMSPPRDRQGKRVRLAGVADIEGNRVTVGQADRGPGRQRSSRCVFDPAAVAGLTQGQLIANSAQKALRGKPRRTRLLDGMLRCIAPDRGRCDHRFAGVEPGSTINTAEINGAVSERRTLPFRCSGPQRVEVG